MKKRTKTTPEPKLRKRPNTHRTPSAPGRSDRTGLSVFQLFELFPDEAAARTWFEQVRWGDSRFCPHCWSENTKPVPNERPQPYHCGACRRYFSIKTGTVMQSSRLPLRTWVMALYLMSTSLKGVSSMKIHRDLGIGQPNAWHLIHRIRKAWAEFVDLPEQFEGPVEVDETYMGGREKNKHGDKKIKAGRGTVGKTAVVGMRDRPTKQIQAEVIERTDRPTLSGFVTDRVASGATVYTDEHSGYDWVQNREMVRHSAKQYVDGQAHTNGIESFWALLKRGYMGTYHKMSNKHLHRYIAEFAGRYNVRSLNTIDQMAALALGMVGKRLRYKDLIENR